MTGRKREPAIRVFASEYNSANLETKGEEEYSPSYLITPMGAQVNRLYFIGVLTEKENIGNEAEPLWRARVKDPTGTFFLSAGSYQPEASQAIRELEPPVLVAVVGKIRTFTTDEGGFYVSVRPERVSKVDKAKRDRWILETARQTGVRLQQYGSAVDQDSPTVEALVSGAKIPSDEAQGIVQAIEHYGVVDVSNYREAVREALNFLLTGKESVHISEHLDGDDILDRERPDEDYGALTSGDDAAGRDQDADMEMEVITVGEEEEGGSGEEGWGSDSAGDDEEAEPGKVGGLGRREPVSAKVAPGPAKDQPASEEKEEAEGLEQRICKAVKELATGPRGASYDDVQKKLESEGVTRTQFEEAVNMLLDKGIIYEPSVNRINVVNY